MVAATASLGLILLWDVDGGLVQIDKYLYSTEDPIKAGALLACGIVNSGIKTDCDPALALLSDYVLHQTLLLRKGSTLGLGKSQNHFTQKMSHFTPKINHFTPKMSHFTSRMVKIE